MPLRCGTDSRQRTRAASATLSPRRVGHTRLAPPQPPSARVSSTSPTRAACTAFGRNVIFDILIGRIVACKTFSPGRPKISDDSTNPVPRKRQCCQSGAAETVGARRHGLKSGSTVTPEPQKRRCCQSCNAKTTSLPLGCLQLRETRRRPRMGDRKQGPDQGVHS